MLSLLCAAPMPLVQNLLQNGHREAFLIPCKAAELAWPTVRTMLASRAIGRTMSDQDLDLARSDYSRLSPGSAQRVLRFWQVRQAASHSGAGAATALPGMVRWRKNRRELAHEKSSGSIAR